jgi:hypothetical protein
MYHTFAEVAKAIDRAPPTAANGDIRQALSPQRGPNSSDLAQTRLISSYRHG